MQKRGDPARFFDLSPGDLKMTKAFLPSYTSARHLALRHFDEHPGQSFEGAVPLSVAQHLLDVGLIDTHDGRRPRHLGGASLRITEHGQDTLKNWSALYAPVRPDPVEIDSGALGD